MKSWSRREAWHVLYIHAKDGVNDIVDNVIMIVIHLSPLRIKRGPSLSWLVKRILQPRRSARFRLWAPQQVALSSLFATSRKASETAGQTSLDAQAESVLFRWWISASNLSLESEVRSSNDTEGSETQVMLRAFDISGLGLFSRPDTITKLPLR